MNNKISFATGWVPIVFGAILLFCPPSYYAQGDHSCSRPSIPIQYKTTTAWKMKCGFDEFEQSSPPRIKMYRKQRVVGSEFQTTYESGYYEDYTSPGGPGWHRFIDLNYFVQTDKGFDVDLTDEYKRPSCALTNTYVGTKWDRYEQEYDGWQEWHGGNGVSWVSMTYQTNSWDDEQSLQRIDGGTTWKWIGTHDEYLEMQDYASDGGYIGEVIVAPDTLSTTNNLTEPAFPWEIVSPTQESYSNTVSLEFGELTQSGTITLSLEYTDTNLVEDVRAILPSMPSEWSDWGYAYALWDVTYYSDIGSHRDVEGRAMLYRIRFEGEDRAVYKVTWQELIWNYETGAVSVEDKTQYVTCVGTNAELTGFVDVPVDPVLIFEINASQTLHQSPPRSPGLGGPEGFDLAGSCQSCSGGSLSGSGAQIGPSLSVSLGATSFGELAGIIRFSGFKPSWSLQTADLLNYEARHPDTESITISNVLRQVKATQTLADIVTVSSNKYEIRFYLPSQISGAKVDGVYPLSGSPFVVWAVENPTPSTNTQLTIKRTLGGEVLTWSYLYTSTNSWKVTAPGGFQESEIQTAFVVNSGITNRQVTEIIRAPGGETVRKAVLTYMVPEEYSSRTYLKEERTGQDSNPLVTTYDYYSTAYGGAIPLKTVIHPDGSWERYGGTDNQGRRYWVIYSYGNQAPTDNGTLARQVNYDYYSVDYSAEDGTFHPEIPRTINESILGTEVSRRYAVLIPTNGMLMERRDIVCKTAYAYASDTNNLVTITKYNVSGAYSGKVQSVENPDGTMQIFEYSAGSGQRTNTIYSGQPNGGKTAIINGTKSATIVGATGEMISRTSTDILSSIVTSSETYSYPSGDNFYQSPRVVSLDGRTNIVNWGCCNVDNEIDRDGTTTQYSYDGLKRRVASTRNSVTTSNVLDAAGHVIRTVRIGSDNSQITLSQAAYDLAGRIIAQTNAVGGVTTYSEITTNSHKIRTTVNPDGGTIVENYFTDGSLESMTGTAVHGERHEKGVETSGPDSDRQYTKTVRLDGTGADTSEWTMNYSDFLGRPYKTVYAAGATPYPFQQSFYNYKGQLWKDVDPDGVANLYHYNAKGESVLTAVDLDQNDTIDFGGTDRVTFTTNDVTTSSGVNVRRSRTYLWATNSVGSSNLVSMMESAVDGLRGWQTQYRDASTPVVSQSRTVYSTGGNRYLTNTAPDGSYVVSAYSYGRLVSMTQKNSAGSQIGQTTYAYDVHGRQSTQTDVRNGATTFTFNNADSPITITTPNPGSPGGTPQTTTSYYNKMLQATNVVHPDGGSVITEYFLTGELKKTYGSETYPVEYTYDYAGRMKTMKTWQNFAGNSGTATTTWNYDAYRGFLTGKVYADSQGPVYTYTPAGRMEKRIWARGAGTTNFYNTAGDLQKIHYSNGTPGVTNTYDRLGRIGTVQNADVTATLAYNWANELLSESYSGGVLNGLAVTNAFDAYLRRTAVGLNAQSSTITSFGYDTAGRLQGVTNGSYNAAYSYLANSPLVSQIVFKTNTTTRMTTTKTYDYLNRLQQISSVPSATGVQPATFAYTYNSANQRTRVNQTDSSFWRYEYDDLGQVKSGKKYWSDQTPVAGQQFEYAFDDIGNRKSTKSGGDENGANLRLANYTATSLNQYTNRDVPGYLDIMGVGLATNAVTVNGLSTYRKGEYFRKELSVDNSSASVWQAVTNASPGQTSVTGNVLLAKTQEFFRHDVDGNLTSDGLWTNRWNAENRLMSVESLTTVPSAARMKEEWSYLADGRWKERIVSAWNGSAYVGQYTNRYIWDGRVLLAVLDHTNGLVMSFMRGLDVARSHQGAGGVGGVLAINIKTNGTHFMAYDGNGNVARLVSGNDGSVSADYEYDPFGQTIRITGAVASVNPIRFSTQYADDVTGDVKYLYRDLMTGPGRWKNRDPIGHSGGLNLYGFAGNNGVNWLDFLGLDIVVNCPEVYFRQHGINPEMYTSQGDHHKAKDGVIGPSSGIGEILWKMLQDSRVFTAGGHSVEQLKQHVSARQNVVRKTFAVYWSMPSKDNSERFNPEYWANNAMGLRSGKKPADAINNAFSSPESYSLGCKYSSMLVMLGGILDTMGSKQFNASIGAQSDTYLHEAARRAGLLRSVNLAPGGKKPTLANWVPGDRGLVDGDGHGLDGGEFIIYLGNGDNFWGFYPDRRQRIRTLQEWVDADFMNGKGSESGKRWWPGVGLER